MLEVESDVRFTLVLPKTFFIYSLKKVRLKTRSLWIFYFTLKHLLLLMTQAIVAMEPTRHSYYHHY